MASPQEDRSLLPLGDGYGVEGWYGQMGEALHSNLAISFGK
jgi:hypothetical protein